MVTPITPFPNEFDYLTISLNKYSLAPFKRREPTNKLNMENKLFASNPNLSSPYFQSFSTFMDSVYNGKSIIENWNLIENLSDESSDKIIFHLIDLACNTQNIENINIGRYFLQKLSKDWLMKRLKRLVKSFLKNGDYWNYLRVLELLSTIDKSLTKEIATKAVQHKDLEIQEVGKGFLV